MYPNLFTILVGRPGIGKGAAINPAMKILQEANTANVLSDRLTIEYVLEKLSKGFGNVQFTATGGMTFGSNATAIVSAPELSIFVRSSDCFPTLCDLWDAKGGKFMYGTRGKGEFPITDACIALLGGSSPQWLCESIPASAVGGGFTRRVNFVYANSRGRSIPFPDVDVTKTRKWQALIEDLRWVSATLKGPFGLEPCARPLFEKVYNDIEPDEFADEATTGYTTSKWVHAIKLAMVLTVSERDDMLITQQNLKKAIDAVEVLEKDIRRVFRAVGGSDLVMASDRILRYLELKGNATRKEILSANWQFVNYQELDVILTTLEQAGMITYVTRGGNLIYSPVQVKKVKP